MDLTQKQKMGALDFLDDYSDDVILGGSVSQRTQIHPKQESYWLKTGRFKGSDFDFYAMKGKNPKALARLFKEKLLSSGVKDVNIIYTKTGARIYSKDLTGTSRKIAEFGSFDKFSQNVLQVEKGLMPIRKAIVKTPEGYNVLNIGTQTKRKLIGAYLDKRWYKDYPDFKQLRRSAINFAKKEIREKVKEGLIVTPKEKTILGKKGVVSLELPSQYKETYKPISTPITLTPFLYDKEITPIGVPPPIKYKYEEVYKPLQFAPITPTYKPPVEPITPTYAPPKITITPTYKPPVEPITPTYKPTEELPLIPILKKKPTPKKPKRAKSYQAFVKEKGKFRKIGKPTSQSNALDLASEYVDITPSATFKVKPSGLKPKKNPGTKRGYFRRNEYKFREYKIRKGAKLPLTKEFIEKRKHRIDKTGERRGITLKGTEAIRFKKLKKLIK